MLMFKLGACQDYYSTIYANSDVINIKISSDHIKQIVKNKESNDTIAIYEFKINGDSSKVIDGPFKEFKNKNMASTYNFTLNN